MSDSELYSDSARFPSHESHLTWSKRILQYNNNDNNKQLPLRFRQLLVEAPEAGGQAGRGQRSAFKLNSVGAQFRTQLRGLMATLNECQPHYVRRAASPSPPPPLSGGVQQRHQLTLGERRVHLGSGS